LAQGRSLLARRAAAILVAWRRRDAPHPRPLRGDDLPRGRGVLRPAIVLLGQFATRW